MIRKFLICGKQPLLLSRNAEAPSVTVVELMMPIRTFWDVDDRIRKLEYLISSGEDPVLINEAQQKIYSMVARYAVAEKDRLMLMALGQGVTPAHGA